MAEHGNKRLEGRTAIVTGAVSGIGLATAKLFVAEGARVLAVDLQDEALSEVFSDMSGIVTLAQSVSDEEAPEKIIDQAVAVFGGLDILMNNAGVGVGTLAEETSDKEWDFVQDVNLKAPFRLSRAAIPHLKKSNAGRIINVSSTAAIATDWGLSAYSASKAGVGGLTRNLALELGKFGITVNHIMPGAIHTGMTTQSFSNEDIAAVWAKKSPLRRLGAPTDVAKVALFLASDDSGFITGQGIQADGGLLLRF